MRMRGEEGEWELAEPEGGSGRWSGTARPVPRVPDAAPSEAPI